MVKENQAVTVYRPMADEGEGNINKIRFEVPQARKPKRQFLAKSDIYFYYIYFFSPNIKFTFSVWY